MSSVGYLLTSSFAPVRSSKSMEAKAALLKVSHKIKQKGMMGERGGGEEWCRGRSKGGKGGEGENNQNVSYKCMKLSKEQDTAVVRHTVRPAEC